MRTVIASLVFAGLLLFYSLLGERFRARKTVPARLPRASEDMVSAGKFRGIHSLHVTEGDETTHDIQNGLANDTCFTPSGEGADASLRVDVLLVPPPGLARYSLADMHMVYRAALVNRRGVVLWRGSEGTRQKMVTAPGVYLPKGTSFYKEIPPAEAAHLLLLELRYAACTLRP
jgi:hypothetical protein